MTPSRSPEPRILVCEAYEGLREGLSLMLNDWASVQFLAGVEDCFPILARQQVDMLILDLDGQAGDPLALVEKLRMTYPKVRVLLVAGQFEYNFQVACVKLGQLSFLTKPFSVPAAVAKIKTLLGLEAPSIRTRVVKITLS